MIFSINTYTTPIKINIPKNTKFGITSNPLDLQHQLGCKYSKLIEIQYNNVLALPTNYQNTSNSIAMKDNLGPKGSSGISNYGLDN